MTTDRVPPRALVVYESMFGNTEQIATAVADGLRRADVDTVLVEVGSAPRTLPAGIDLLVLGAPTHAFALSRPSTRADAVRQGAPPERARAGLREWLDSVELGGAHPPEVVAFDTRVSKVRWLPRAAGPSALRLARKHGLDSHSHPVGFLVDDVSGPLLDGELERALAWGRRVGAELVDRLTAASGQSR